MLGERKIQAFFTLLRAGLWNRPVDREDCFPLSAPDWETVYQYGVRQTVEGILFDGIQLLPTIWQPPMDTMLKWLVRIEKIKQRNTWMNGIISKQMLFFNYYDLWPILLKGQGLGQVYAQPERRSCGDIDWYFNTAEDFRRANELLNEYGIDIHFNPGYTSSYSWEGAEVDQHQRVFDIHNPFAKKYLRELEAAQQSSAVTFAPREGTEVHLLSPLLQIIQAAAHILKHQLSFGVGLRQLCDIANLYSYYYGQYDAVLLSQVYRKLGISRWIELLHQLLVDFLGLSEDVLPGSLTRPVGASWMMAEIWAGGNFGFYDDARVQSGEGQYLGRKSRTRKILGNFWKYLPYAPMEAISFPIAHYCSTICRS